MTTRRKIFLSMAVTAGFFLVLEGVLALAGVRAASYAADPYVGFSSTSRLFVEAADRDDVPVMVTSEAKTSLFNRQRFPVDKGDVFRIFCVGGSTTFGRPYDDATSFCGWLRELLPVADPHRRWEVINAGGVSYASYRVAVLMEELADYEPDLFVVYSGHNEFLERRTYPQIIATPEAVRGLGSMVSKTRVWTAVSGIVHAVSGPPPAPEDSPDLLSEEVRTLLDDAVGPDAFTRDDELRDQVIRHFRFNLTRMVDIALSAGAETLFITPASNLKDSSPFKSEHRGDLTADEKARFDELMNETRLAYGEGRVDDALARIGEAVAIDPRFASLAFLEGRMMAEARRWDRARAAFERARDEDVCPLRGVAPIPSVVREVAAERGVGLVDFEALADAWAADGIPGADLFLDHVHPTIQVHRRLAVAVIDAMAKRGLVVPGDGWTEAAIADVADRVESSVDTLDHALALMKLSKVLGWAGKLEESFRLAEQAAELFPDDSRIQYNAGLTAHLLGRKDIAVGHYRRAVEIQPDADEPHGNLGVLLEEAGRYDEAVHHFRLAIRYARSPETIRRNRANLARALMVTGYLDYNRGRTDGALAKLEEAADLAPGNLEILGRLGVAQLATEKTADAVRTFETAADTAPDDGAVLNRLALALALDGQAGRAAQSYRRALELDAGVVDLPDNLFRVLGTMGRTDLANEIRQRMGE
ncbi:MAG: tetratricopeptide repeat protein [Thermoanaerobaculales bacterium]|jgi:tetratricopeptide (TPR) repeat protein|nr:tetratricopeptide repeat protein [Thermoanaerobaculales bacterium]